VSEIAPSRRRRRWPWWVAGLAALCIVLVLYSGLVVFSLIHPSRDVLRTNPGLWGLNYQNVTFPSKAGGLELKGWWIPSTGAGLTVVLAHGYSSNRAMASLPGLALATALHNMGANVLMFDFRAEGASPGTEVTVGVKEQWDLVGAVEAARKTLAPGVPVAVIGFSMGASTALLAAEDDPNVVAVVADSPFANLKTYLEANLPVWTHLPAVPFNAIIMAILPIVSGAHASQADPLAGLAKLGSRPVLLIAGLTDQLIPYQNSVLLYQTAKKTDPHASLWLVPMALHTGSFQVQPVAYLTHLYAFLHPFDPALKPPVLHPVGL